MARCPRASGVDQGRGLHSHGTEPAPGLVVRGEGTQGLRGVGCALPLHSDGATQAVRELLEALAGAIHPTALHAQEPPNADGHERQDPHGKQGTQPGGKWLEVGFVEFGHRTARWQGHARSRIEEVIHAARLPVAAAWLVGWHGGGGPHSPLQAPHGTIEG